MLGAMNWDFLMLYNSKENSSFSRKTPSVTSSSESVSNNNPKKKWKWEDKILKGFEIAKKFMITGQTPDNIIINNILGTSISDNDLFNLLNGPKYKFSGTNLVNHKHIIKKLRFLGEKLCTYSGVYIWTHIPSGNKYVGSAINLPARLRSYFTKIPPTRIVGKFLPFLKTHPIGEFNLEVIFTPSNTSYSSKNNEEILEQYFLLLSEFTFNTIRVSNNPSGSSAMSLFIYNRDGSICYFSSTKQIDFVINLGINHTTFTKHRDNGTYYLGKYLFTQDELVGATFADITVSQVRNMLNIDRISNNKNKAVVGFSVSVVLVNIVTKKQHSFPSLGATVKFLKNSFHVADQRTLVKRLNTEIPYCGYLCYKA